MSKATRWFLVRTHYQGHTGRLTSDYRVRVDDSGNIVEALAPGEFAISPKMMGFLLGDDYEILGRIDADS